MNVKTYIALLKQQTDILMTDDSASQIMASAVRGYSRYVPLKRRFGEGALATKAAAATGTSSDPLEVVGGPYKAGDVITIDTGQPWEETRTVASVARIDPTGTQPTYIGAPQTVVLTAVLTSVHYAGAVIAKTTPGLTLIADQVVYPMPGDFIWPEGESWGFATGQRYALKRTESFYNGVYAYSQTTSGVTWGMSQNFAGGDAALNFGWVGLPGIPAGVLNVPGSVPMNYVFSEGQDTLLTLFPTPTQAQTLDFYYWADQLPETVPDKDMDAVIDLGVATYLGIKYAALITPSTTMTGFDVKEGSESVMISPVMRSLSTLMMDRTNNFMNKIARRPILLQG